MRAKNVPCMKMRKISSCKMSSDRHFSGDRIKLKVFGSLSANTLLM